VLFIDSPDGETAAYVWTALEWDGQSTSGRIWMTGVMPEFRKAGLGRAVVNAGIKHLLAEGASSISLEVVEHNTAAVRIYRQLGFKQTGRVAWYDLEL
jgi:mycothiol synthase